MPVTKMVISYEKPRRKPRRKPKEGDRKTVKGIEYVRRQERSRYGYHTRNGRPVWEWVKAS